MVLQVHPQVESYWGHVNPIGPRACYDEGKRVAETMSYTYANQVRSLAAMLLYWHVLCCRKMSRLEWLGSLIHLDPECILMMVVCVCCVCVRVCVRVCVCGML